jgi:hypothetical protein
MTSRRQLISAMAVVLLAPLAILSGRSRPSGLLFTDIRSLERPRILPAAERFLAEAPVTVTSARSARSAGGLHDYFSEGDYWWPDPANPDGPYIQRDGMSNPDNFVAHRRAMVRLATIVPTLVSAWRLTGDERYARQAVRHLRAWFVDEDTQMAPHLRYAQAIQGRATGRGTGIIDTIHLVEVARSVEWLGASRAAAAGELTAVRQWFADYLAWLTTHEYGIAERDAQNNHATCWVMQVAAFAHLVGDERLLAQCRERFKTVLVPGQMARDGSFPLELKRTKPYGYSLFNLDALATTCQILSAPANGTRAAGTRRQRASALFSAPEDLWAWSLPDGRGMRRAMQFLVPFIRDKAAWPFARDVMYFDQWPARHSSLLFAGLALNEPGYLELWAALDPSPTVEEVVRNLPVRHPLLWVD